MTLVELMAAAGLDSVGKIERRHVNRRVDLNRIVRYDQIFLPVETGCLLDPNTVPDSFKPFMEELESKSSGSVSSLQNSIIHTVL